MTETKQQDVPSDCPEEEQQCDEEASVDEEESDEYSPDRTDLSENNVGLYADLYFQIRFCDWSCNCQFCGPVLPKVFDIAKRERPEEEMKLISGLLLQEDGETPTSIPSLSVRNLSTFRRVEQDSSSTKSFDIARRWFHDCVEHHEACKAASTPVLPKRFLAISNQAAHPTVRLVVDSGLEGSYAALSHCWGTDKFLRLTTANVGEFEQDIPWISLPRSFQDAIKVCLELELSNIWIDSLCILQDRNDDWETQSFCMAKIYHDATVVIAASSAFGAHEGFLGLRKGYFDDCLISPDSNSRGLYAMSEIHTFDPDYGQTLNTRAWAYQERLLARRYLSFGQKELLWECESSWHCECGLCGTETSRDQAYYVWRNTIVSRYSVRALSVPSDRLPALSAIAQVFQAKLQDTYLAGLWKRDLLKGLCWSRGRRSDKYPDPPRGNIAPTWSWCAVEAPAYNCTSRSEFTPYSECLQAECTPPGINEFGEVKDGSITLRGPLVKAFVGLSARGINPGEYTIVGI
ncbi:hypothetical protein PG997_002739 [Apiospora hydei]|uniref:Heterokaryon incompatibility domain-containing protein n=1 Tax=Apiospora hydei TaxID=1337664 RepID=A0ABR1WXC7_9PEZI